MAGVVVARWRDGADPVDGGAMRWTRKANRSYYRETEHTQSFLFGCSKPMQLWAWAVFWVRGRSSGVAMSYALAKRKAEEDANTVEAQWL